MNCQAFRNNWLTHTDNEMLSHIETCEACITWLESQTQDEEVQFLKEVPPPPANLEDRIMQAIYQTSEQAAPPHAATMPLQDATQSMTTKSNPRQRRFPSFAWVSAAAVLLIVSAVGYQQLQKPMVETAYEVPSGSQQEPSAAGIASVPESASSQEDPTESPELASEQPASAARVEEPQTATPSEQPIASFGFAATAPPEQPIGTTEPAADTHSILAADTSRAVTKENRPAIVARNASPKPPTYEQANEQPAKKEHPPIVSEEVNLAASVAEEPSPEMSVAAAIMRAPVYALTMAPEEEMGTLADLADKKSQASPPTEPVSESSPITLSTFTDVETAVQASDMPVPVLNELPDGMGLGGISIRYESETSQKVAKVMAEYQNASSWIKVEVERNGNSKRSLSIPGTFTATQLFSVNNEQAIGVTFEKQPEQTASHAVHFNALSGDHSLYVVMTAHGIPLETLMGAAKKITWKP